MSSPTLDPEPASMQQNASFDVKRVTDFLAEYGDPGDMTVLDYYPVVDSTMRAAHSLGMRNEIGSGSIVVADAQSAGRGRLGRSWEAPPGSSLLMSMVLKRGPAVHYDTRYLPLVAGLAVQRTLARLHIPDVEVGIKWPNDILLRDKRGVERKVAGVLIESTMQAEGMKGHVVVGIGINVTQTAAQLPQVEPPAPQPTSLLLAGATVDRTDLLISLWQAFWEAFQLDYNRSRRTFEPPPLLRAWRAVVWTLGRPVSIHHADGAVLHGLAVDVADDGALIVEDGEGLRHTVYSGDVSMRADTQ